MMRGPRRRGHGVRAQQPAVRAGGVLPGARHLLRPTAALYLRAQGLPRRLLSGASEGLYLSRAVESFIKII